MERISHLAEKIQEREQKKQELARDLRDSQQLEKIAKEKDGVAEPNSPAFKQVEKDQLREKRIVGVDGGLQSRQLQGVDIILTRAVGALFQFKQGSLASCSYLPERKPQPELDLTYQPLRRSELNVKRSLLRLKAEISVAIGALAENPDLLLLDGSIFPQSRDRPQEGSAVASLYQEILNLYQRLYRQAQNKRVLVAGVVEDSRSSRFLKLIKDEESVDQSLLNNFRDTDFLSELLQQGERTFTVKYTQDQQQHPVLRQLNYQGEMYSFYLKPAVNDQPLRIDFKAESPTTIVDKLASLILPLSTLNANYAVPSVIIEADQRAKVDEKNLDRYERMLKAKSGLEDSLKPMRRNKRPFS